MQMLGSVSANNKHSSAVTRCLQAWKQTPKILSTETPTKTSLITAQAMQEPKKINDESYDGRQLAAFRGAYFCSGTHIHNTPGNNTSERSSVGSCAGTPECTDKHAPRKCYSPNSQHNALSAAYASSRQLHTRTEWDGTGHPSFTSNPGAQASRQGTDHTFSQICSKFIPEPTRQTKTGSMYHYTRQYRIRKSHVLTGNSKFTDPYFTFKDNGFNSSKHKGYW